jgi:hypothetical protein
VTPKEDEILEILRELQEQVDDIKNGIYEPPSGAGHGTNRIALPNDLHDQNKQIIEQQQEILNRMDQMSRDS